MWTPESAPKAGFFIHTFINWPFTGTSGLTHKVIHPPKPGFYRVFGSYAHIHSPYGGYCGLFNKFIFIKALHHRKEVIHTMKLFCSKTELQKSVNIVMKAVPGKTTMPILECILIDASTNDIKFTSNDMELGIETRVQGMILEKGIIALDAKIFSEIIRKLPDSDVTIETDEKLNTTITCEKAKFNIPGKSGEDFAYLPLIEKNDCIRVSQFTLKEIIRQTIFSIALNENNKLDVAKAVGKGILTVIKDIGLKEPYVGKCNLITSEIAEDFAYYFYTSEQTPSVVSLGVNIGKDQKVQMAAGYIIQPLPDCDESIIDILETINNNISSVTNLMLDLSNIDDVAKTITGDNDIVLTETKNINYVCDCNEKRIENVIIALGKDEAIKAANDNNGILELTCHFCNKVYRFNINDIEKIFNDEVK